MKILSFYGGHDANLSFYDSSQNKLKYIKEERERGIKHYNPYEGIQDKNKRQETVLNFVRSKCESENFEPDVIIFTDGNRANIGVCPIDTLYEQKSNNMFVKHGFDPSCEIYCVDHHYCHILSCWPLIATENVEIGIALDSTGDHDLSGRIIQTPVKPVIIHNEKNSTGKMLSRIALETMNLKGNFFDLAGKLMGAQAYGEIDHELLQSIDYDFFNVDIATNWRKYKTQNTFGSPEFNNWLKTMHYLAEQYTTNLFEKYCTTNQVISYSGGVAQNSVINETLNQNYKIFIAPHCYDGGLSLGGIELARIIYKLPIINKPNFPYWQNDFCQSTPTEKTLKTIAEHLSQGKIVGWFQGHGELGPRALGNRSILMDPRISNAKHILNSKIKHREYWRPYASSVLEEKANEWFDIKDNSPYMLRAVQTKIDQIQKIQSVVHIDGTNRIQTVNRQQNQIFYDLIQNFYQITGIPMLVNTSLNIDGWPILSNKQQCIELLYKSEIDLICFGNQIIKRIF